MSVAGCFSAGEYAIKAVMAMTLEEILSSHHTGRTAVMGVLNVTPDSFSDGGKFLGSSTAVEHAREMIDQGADILDIGAESTRPGSADVSPEQQISRLREILPGITGLGAVVSIDTASAKVAEFALDAGAAIINDVSAGRGDPDMLPLAAGRNAPVILMHMLGEPRTMQGAPRYQDVVAEVRDFLSARLDAAQAAGVGRSRCIVDPGIGFGKLLEHNLALLSGIDQLLSLDCPVLVGPSRKRFIGEITGQADTAERLAGTLAACLAAWRRGATILRVHDVRPLADALKVAEAIAGAARRDPTQ